MLQSYTVERYWPSSCSYFLCSAGHSCGEEDYGPGKHLWSCTAWSLHTPRHHGQHSHPAPSAAPFFMCLHWCESETQPTQSLRPRASTKVAWQESTMRRRGGTSAHRRPQHFRSRCQRAPADASAIHFHNHCFFVWETLFLQSTIQQDLINWSSGTRGSLWS